MQIKVNTLLFKQWNKISSSAASIKQRIRKTKGSVSVQVAKSLINSLGEWYSRETLLAYTKLKIPT